MHVLGSCPLFHQIVIDRPQIVIESFKEELQQQILIRVLSKTLCSSVAPPHLRKKLGNKQESKVTTLFLQSRWKMHELHAKHFFIRLSHAHFHFWGQECVSNISISKHYPKSDAAPSVKTSSTSRACHAHDTWFYWSSKNALHEYLSLSSGMESEWKCYSSPLSIEKGLWSQLVV